MLSTYYPTVIYNNIPCQLLYADKESYYYTGREGWLLIADISKTKADKLIPLGFEFKKDCFMLGIDDETAHKLASVYNTEQKMINKITKALFVPVIWFICLIFLWKLPIYAQINLLRLPENTETVYRAKVHISDVYWLHVLGDKVVKCEEGYEYAKKYIEENNPKLMRWHIGIYEYGGMSDISIYDAEFDHEWLALPKTEKDRYIRIRYFKMFEDPTPIDLISLVMAFWFFCSAAWLVKLSFRDNK
ncbi:MAG: hypothetical protein IJ062_00555 [Firmicutes bacterium]|nr:hypothetical protein [Bacillota bacterium]